LLLLTGSQSPLPVCYYTLLLFVGHTYRSTLLQTHIHLSLLLRTESHFTLALTEPESSHLTAYRVFVNQYPASQTQRSAYATNLDDLLYSNTSLMERRPIINIMLRFVAIPLNWVHFKYGRHHGGGGSPRIRTYKIKSLISAATELVFSPS
jgi:hypothetical protein